MLAIVFIINALFFVLAVSLFFYAKETLERAEQYRAEEALRETAFQAEIKRIRIMAGLDIE